MTGGRRPSYEAASSIVRPPYRPLTAQYSSGGDPWHGVAQHGISMAPGGIALNSTEVGMAYQLRRTCLPVCLIVSCEQE